VRRLNSKARG